MAFSVIFTVFTASCIIATVSSHPNLQKTGSSSYVRWGRTTCPSTCDTSLVYSGRVGGSHYLYQGGAADYICLPDNPEYSDFTPGFGRNQERQARLYGAEYETGTGHNSLGPFGNSHHEHNVPCAVCATMARGMQLMIPARVNCPDDSWTKEYSGYLMTNSDQTRGNYFHRTKFICVDREAENIPNTSATRDGALLYHVRVAVCGAETFPCSAYDPQKELTCVVCSK